MAETSFNNAFQLFNQGDASAEAWADLRARFWDAVKGDKLPHGVDIAAYALALRHGVDAVKPILAKAKRKPVLDAIDHLCAAFADSDDVRAAAREMSLEITP